MSSKAEFCTAKIVTSVAFDKSVGYVALRDISVLMKVLLRTMPVSGRE